MSLRKTVQLNPGLIKHGNARLGRIPPRHGIFSSSRSPPQINSYTRMLATFQHGSTNLTPLEQQRLRRPVSPHMTIYKWQYQSLTSILQRFSGIFLAGGLYVFATGYVLTPIVSPGYTDLFDIETIVGALREVPGWIKGVGKFALSMPFTYHFYNGVKHLMWDLGVGLSHKRFFGRLAWVVAGFSVVSSLGLAVL
ncbi:succinate dehydrogenase, putative [Talaromyces stipitatus ATCC 10500]|uniref:Succinate dehydrogenase, putative n=1 Tax=Talaromyces stipitatus (strain ATCC 10500 / CBS 375.48 / QM 6759 / NRRL 1006) TaxID=441959 RepID=B8M3Y0_TALSN|nr:succinate dehydrogenase, putative [Talaromyces stipitatus ATCC 10500]EED20723.1 succinate dehydrogenase, putative [Talaromyces stipitatus ATCC 10500]